MCELSARNIFIWRIRNGLFDGSFWFVLYYLYKTQIYVKLLCMFNKVTSTHIILRAIMKSVLTQYYPVQRFAPVDQV